MNTKKFFLYFFLIALVIDTLAIAYIIYQIMNINPDVENIWQVLLLPAILSTQIALYAQFLPLLGILWIVFLIGIIIAATRKTHEDIERI